MVAHLFLSFYYRFFEKIYLAVLGIILLQKNKRDRKSVAVANCISQCDALFLGALCNCIVVC